MANFKIYRQHQEDSFCIQTPAGVEEFFERMSLLAESGPPDVAKMVELAR